MRPHQDKEDWGVSEEAALWVIRLKEPDAERYVPEFERWCAKSPMHHDEILTGARDRQRAVELISGEALFKVAKDPTRPFRVYSAHAVIEDLSTEFNVRQKSGSTTVVVTEGRVRVLGNRLHRNARGATPGISTTELKLGEEAIITANADNAALVTKQLSPTELNSAVAWREGFLHFSGGITLIDAVAEFNRYNEHKIQVDDPRIAGLRLGGRFRATAPEEFVRDLPSMLPIKAIEPHAGARSEEPIRLIGVGP